ncbi:protein of unknown function [Pseudarcicella hirudinis]|uniref:DUF4136 domain-containing protein n=1 Tax=Pseudarcicella hirudinis TaxID=1079859 RepID=A0A1I5SJG5_9BACT|nr:DUF4136 domain-containing protein [Pseudarcicella hirudinis]SFP70853.1 protein of unknown function [Pseudarcicella hirudinis]
MKRLTILVALALGLGLSSCSSVKVDQKPTANFLDYKRYAWVKPNVLAGNNPFYKSSLVEANIKSAIRNEFAMRGITEDNQNPDFFLMYHIFTQQKTRTVSNPYSMYPYYGFGPRSFYFQGQLMYMGYGGYYNPWGMGYHMEPYTNGTLIIDVIDARTKELVWRGSVENPVNDPARLSKQFSKEARTILAKYPVMNNNRN